MEAPADNHCSPEEGELEDGEICDDEAVESVPSRRRGDGNRPGRGAAPHRGLRPPPPMDFRLLLPYNLPLHGPGPGPFSSAHRQHCGSSGPDRPPSAPPLPPGRGPHGEPSPRSNFWERSHGALGRFRHRVVPNAGRGGWNRGNRGPMFRYGLDVGHGSKTESPPRKQKGLGRTHQIQVRKVPNIVSRVDEGVDESFEDLLSKYRQIQLELECIRKEETKVLEPNQPLPVTARVGATDPAYSTPEPRPAHEVISSPAAEKVEPVEQKEKKGFRAFNIKPLRQKLAPPTHLDLSITKDSGGDEDAGEDGEKCGEEDQKKQDGDKPVNCVCCAVVEAGDEEGTEKIRTCCKESSASSKGQDADKHVPCVCCGVVEAGDEEGTEKARTCCRESSASSEDSTVSLDKVGPQLEEEELSELQLRLLALQSASKKWQQKEQQVMKKSRDRITRAAQDKRPIPSKRPTSGSSQEKRPNSTLEKKPTDKKLNSIADKKPGSGPDKGPASGSVPDKRPGSVLIPDPSSGAAPTNRQRVTRSTSSAANTVTDRARTRSTTQDKDRDWTKGKPRLQDKDRDRPKPSPKTAAERGRKPGKLHGNKKTPNSGSSAKQAVRKQQLRTWKLQQQRQDEDERRRREDEIRRIRDLSNQDEQYNRFMMLVGGIARTRSQSRDRDHRKSTGKAGLDTSGNLYQYDNYEEVAMDTDSETGSPVPSPTHSSFQTEGSGVAQVSPYGSEPLPFGLPFLSPLLPSTVAPPPPPVPPPPEDLEVPPKPPFADEEEEEEMLLRETCLMSMANKRGVLSDLTEKTSSSPASPSDDTSLNTVVQPPSRGNLSTVSLNTVPQLPASKFNRGGHAHRAPLVLPRHKSVVVSLKDSDDSDSDVDACSAPQSVFGGLEFMIKEARRTVEATKPKATSGSEKENNPLRTVEAKKAEVVREKQKTLMAKNQSLRTSTPSAVTESAVNLAAGRMAAVAEMKLSEAEQKLQKTRELLQKDEEMLLHLLQQEMKKRESLKNAEAKVSRLREQLQASEKIASANRTLLKKLQEQVHRVEHRVSTKKALAARQEQEVAAAQLAAGRVSKRRTDAIHTTVLKRQRVDGASVGSSERHFAELMAQKQRLQQLESEYALKIQRLKEAQALHNRGIQTELSRDSVPQDLQVQVPAPSSPFPVPQPSLHDLTQDKLVLDSEDISEADDTEAEPLAATAEPAKAATAHGPRRLSLGQSSSFTKPHLEQLSTSSPKDSSKATKTSSESTVETSAGLDLDALKLSPQQQEPLIQILQRELLRLQDNLKDIPPGQVMMSLEVDVAPRHSPSTDLKPVPFACYRSPLLVFKSYRFSPYYRTKEKLSLSSVSNSNTIQPTKFFCRFDLTGTCNDDHCRWQHMRNCTLSGSQLFQDLLSYNLSLIGCSESSSDEDVHAATETYMKKLFGNNKDRMGVDQKAVLLVSKVNESRRHVPPFTTWKDVRRWRPKPLALSSRSCEEDNEQETFGETTAADGHDVHFLNSSSVPGLDICAVSPEDKRYFISETDDISNLESSVIESPCDAQLWIKLAFKYLDSSVVDSLEGALNTLSRALESNCDDPEIWTHYLLLFSRRGSREEVQEMCEMAVEHAPDYRVWWTFLTLETTFEGKDYACERLLQFLNAEASSGVTDKLSFHLMEALLYRVQLNLFTGRTESATAIFQNALKSTDDRSIADHLITRDRALVWLSFINLIEFHHLPSWLYDPAESGPSRLVSRESFMLPWRTQQDVNTPPEVLVAVFHDAVAQCGDESLSPSERVLSTLPLYLNLILLYKVLHRYAEGIELCQSLLLLCPHSCSLVNALADLHLLSGDEDRAVNVWLQVVSQGSDAAELFYGCCRFLMAQEKTESFAPLFRVFVLSLCEDQQNQATPVEVLRHVLGFSNEQLLKGTVIRKDLQDQLDQIKPFLHLIHCRWQWLFGSVDSAVEAFERALGSDLQLDQLHILWMDYLQFSSSSRVTHDTVHSRSRTFSDLVQRCLTTVPTRLEIPFNPAEFWTCYRFHNKVIAFYMRLLPPSQHALLLERLRSNMNNNTELHLRLLCQELQDGNLHQVKFQTRVLTNSFPRNQSVWKLAVGVEMELQQKSEVRLLFQQALVHLPLSAQLWTHRLLFEAADHAPPERLKRLVDRCEQVGVSLVGGATRDDG